MPEIDIKLPDSINEALNPPQPRGLCIPFPPEPAKLRVPGGAQLYGIGNVSEKIPDDCTLTFSLFAQLGPILGNFKCIFDILSLLGPLIEIIGGLAKVPPQPPSPKVLQDFAEAAGNVAMCVAQFTTPVGLAQFIVDILDLILKILKCVLGALKTALSMLTSISLDLAEARAAENDELIAMLECAQENALNSANASLTAIEPIPAILDIISAVMEIVGADPIEFPSIENTDSVEGLETIVETLEDVVETITTVRNAIPV